MILSITIFTFPFNLLNPPDNLFVNYYLIKLFVHLPQNWLVVFRIKQCRYCKFVFLLFLVCFISVLFD